jgi:hypothetical protein
MIRRTGIAMIIGGALIAVVTGVLIVGMGIEGLTGGEPFWGVVGIATGLTMVGTAGICVYLAANDIRAGRLSPRAEWWTWTATLAFVVPFLVTIWFFYIGFLGALASFVAVGLARGPRPSAA